MAVHSAQCPCISTEFETSFSLLIESFTTKLGYLTCKDQSLHAFSRSQVRTMIDEGFLSLLTGDLSGLERYWSQLLLDFPNHPAHGQEFRSIPLTLYGASTWHTVSQQMHFSAYHGVGFIF